MKETPKIGLLPIYDQATPSSDDPPDADKFYLALGVAIIAWGRLEGNFVACLMMVIQAAKDKLIATKLPTKWDRQAIIWKDAFARIPSLKSHEKDAAAFFTEFEDLYKDRNLMIHALWERFLWYPSLGIPHPPLGIAVLKIKAISGGDVEFRRTVINIEELATFTAQANHLNSALIRLISDLSPLQGPLPSNVRIL